MMAMYKPFLGAAVLVFLCVGGSYAACAEERIVLRGNKALQLCQELGEILSLPENKGYITADRNWEKIEKFRKKLFYIPEDRKNFSTNLKWSPSSEDELKEHAPDRYSKLVNSSTVALPKMHVTKKALDVANINDPRVIYRVSIDGYSHYKFYMEERDNDPVSRNFNETAGGSREIFYYKGRVYFSNAGTHYLRMWISEPTYIKSIHELGLIQVCSFGVEK